MSGIGVLVWLNESEGAFMSFSALFRRSVVALTTTVTISVVALTILSLAACGGGASDSSGSSLTGQVAIDGSSTVFPLTALAA